MSESILNLLWGKSDPYKSLEHHMIDAGCCAQALMRQGPGRALTRRLTSRGLSEEEAVAVCGYAVSNHDIGKAHPYYQSFVKGLPQVKQLNAAGFLGCSPTTEKFRHELYTEKVLSTLWKNNVLFSSDDAKTLARALAMHHQGKFGKTQPLPAGREQPWLEAQMQLDLRMRAVFAPPCLKERGSFFGCDADVMEFLGLTVMADWIASGQYFFVDESLTADEYPAQARLAAETALQRCGVIYGAPMPDFASFSAMWPDIPEESQRPIQSQCGKMSFEDVRMCLIEAPMGEGKTEAALFAADRMTTGMGKDGLYVALPTAATSNQMHSRIDKLFKCHGLQPTRLLHGMAWLVDKTSSQASQTEDAEAVSQWLKPLRRGLLSQFAVGTVDQVMMSVLQVKYGALRLLGLSGKVLVIDEIHAYDAYMLQIIERLLEWCVALNVPVILLSATLPVAKKKTLMAVCGAVNPAVSNGYPLITTVDGRGQVMEKMVPAFMHRTYRFRLEPLMDDVDGTARLALKLTENGGCLCALMDTVNGAQRLYARLKELCPADLNLSLFHARFPAERRQQLERRCIDNFGYPSACRPRRAILVATQVVEQSLDVDFDVMITQMAPIDLLMQRAGRVFRHQDTWRPPEMAEPTIYVLTSPDGDYRALGKIYVPLLLNRTEAFLNGHSEVKIPDGMRQCIEDVYQRDDALRKIAAEELKARAEMAFKEQSKQNAALSKMLPAPGKDKSLTLELNPKLMFTSDNDDEAFNAPQTRLGDDSIRVALVDPETLAGARDNAQDADWAQRVMMRSVGLRPLSDPLPEGAWKGEYLMKGCLLLPERDGAATAEKWRIIDDEELGIRVEKIKKTERT